MKKLLSVAVLLLMGEVVWAKAPVMPLYCYRSGLDAKGGIAAINSGTGTVEITKKLWNAETIVPRTNNGDGTPMTGRFGTYSIQANAWSSYWLDARDIEGGLGCGAATGFTISFWFRPTSSKGSWSDFFSFRLGSVEYNFEYDNTAPRSFLVYSSSIQHLRQRHGVSWNAPTAVKTGG